MLRTPQELLIESSLKAVCLLAFSHPIGACCALVLSSFIETEPIEKLIDLLGEEAAKAIGSRISEGLTEVEPGSLPEAVVLALAQAIKQVHADNREATQANGWDTFLKNSEASCKRIKRYRWKQTPELAVAVGTLHRDPHDWNFLRETLILLDWSARLSGASNANRKEMPEGLGALLRAHLGEEFIDQLKELLASGKFDRAHVDLTFEIAALVAAHPSPPRSISRRLSGSDDARLRPMRGFFTGREPQVRAVVDFLQSDAKLAVVTGQVYSVHGGPGIGKTELCKAALQAYLRTHPECRAYYIDVTGVRSLDGLRVALADALGNQRLAEDAPTLLKELQSQTDLIYLDNLEDALPERGQSSEDVFQWLEAMVRQEVKVLASSRRKLGLIAQEFALGALSAAEAATVFEHFWNLAHGEPITERAQFDHFIQHDLGCHALTLRLLAAQAADWGTWQTLRAQWLKFRTKLAADAGRRARQSSLDVSLSLSFDQIRNTGAAAKLWTAFACFPAGMRVAAQQAVMPDEAELRDAVNLLKRLGIIYQAPDSHNGRFEMLAPFRQFAIEQDRALTIPVWETCLGYFAAIALWAQSRSGAKAAGVANRYNCSRWNSATCRQPYSSPWKKRFHWSYWSKFTTRCSTAINFTPSRLVNC